MKSRSKELVDKSILAMVSAIEIYNKPNFSYREETFAILAVNSWELLFKAKWLTLNKNKLSSLYVHEKNGNIKKTRTQNPFTHSLDYLVTNLIQKQEIQEEVKKNLDAVIEMRDSAIHFYHKSNELAMKLQGIGMATLKNYVSLIKKWFDSDLSNFNFFLMPLSFITVPRTVGWISGNARFASHTVFLPGLFGPTRPDPF